ncbi:anti-anti-sigma factor [Amycolatopsis pretoriensis]|uniref:Anti-anti-sigma factor n=1 Tax=Amycolatopsis pretoriensis TaxID=218821 RepID=A0A1H5Q3J7_9PSEU|nr:STAS domain-containing protein [Amycolatopsis pretoriensis]SEF19991.1 anti-anti-sigma factor [Amycolatopsis pretoriensis]
MTGSFQPERLQVVRTRGESGVVVLALSGELDAGTAPKLGEAAVQVFASDPEVLVLDLSELSFLSVAGVREVRAAHDRTAANRLRVVTGDRPAVREFLHATGFEAVLDCYRTRIGAITAGSRAEFVSHAKAAWEAG